MKIASLSATCLLAGALAGAMLMSVAQSQPRSMHGGAPIEPDDPVKLLQSQVTAQTQEIATLQTRMAMLEAHVDGLQNRVDAHPTGRHKAGISKLNWNSVPDDALIEYWDIDR